MVTSDMARCRPSIEWRERKGTILDVGKSPCVLTLWSLVNAGKEVAGNQHRDDRANYRQTGIRYSKTRFYHRPENRIDHRTTDFSKVKHDQGLHTNDADDSDTNMHVK
jgi:hypothetical protein